MQVTADNITGSTAESIEVLNPSDAGNAERHSLQFGSVELLGIARRFAADFGWSILPVRSNKIPTISTWKRFQTTRPSILELEEMFRIPGCTGLAVIAGAVSGDLVVRDFDVEEDYHCWAENHPSLAATLPTVRTGRGYHVYFRSTRICSTHHYYRDGAHVGELRGSGYTLLPPSKHPDGGRYRWLVEPANSIPFVEDAIAAGVERPDLVFRPDKSNKGISDICTPTHLSRGRDGTRAHVRAVRVEVGRSGKAMEHVFFAA